MNFFRAARQRLNFYTTLNILLGLVLVISLVSMKRNVEKMERAAKNRSFDEMMKVFGKSFSEVVEEMAK